jgi:CPA1 family monovalent cation:H+ antiporter
MLRPTVGSGLVISWAGMRGIVTLAAAMALPIEFPYRDPIALIAFSVVLGTLVVQGLTLKPLMHARLSIPIPEAARLLFVRRLPLLSV